MKTEKEDLYTNWDLVKSHKDRLNRFLGDINKIASLLKQSGIEPPKPNEMGQLFADPKNWLESKLKASIPKNPEIGGIKLSPEAYYSMVAKPDFNAFGIMIFNAFKPSGYQGDLLPCVELIDGRYVINEEAARQIGIDNKWIVPYSMEGKAILSNMEGAANTLNQLIKQLRINNPNDLLRFFTFDNQTFTLTPNPNTFL